MNNSRLAACAVASALVSCPAPAAEDPVTASSNADLVKRLDPTDFRTRFETRAEHQETQDGGQRQLLVPRFEYALSKAVAFRIETPVLRYQPGATQQPRESGFGDLLLRGQWRAARTPGFALVLGSEFILDTASERTLGFGKHIVAPFAFASFDAPSLNSTVFPGIQHYASVAGQPGRQPVSYSQLRLFILTRWPNRFYTGIENQFTVDHERNGRTGFTIETEVGRFLDKHWAVWLRPGVALLGNDLPYIYNWNLEAGFRYVFD